MRQNLPLINQTKENKVYLIDFISDLRWAAGLTSLYSLYRYLNPKDIAEIILSTPYDRCSDDEFFWYRLESVVPDDIINEFDLMAISYFIDCYSNILDRSVKSAIPENTEYGNCVFSGWINETTMLLVDYDLKEKIINSNI